MDLEKTVEDAPATKRANLDHLSPEDQLMEKKLKKRAAAQTARNKKKEAIDSMKTQLAEAQARLQENLEANAELVKTNTKLQMENASLQIQNRDLQARFYPLCTSMDDGGWRTDAQKKFFESPDLVSQLPPKTDAQKKFFLSPDLVSQLLPFLDLSSTLVLASILPLARQLLQRKFIWRGLIRRSLQNLDDSGKLEKKMEDEEDEEDKENEEDAEEEIFTKVEQLVKILQKLESPEPLLQDLLDFICEKFETVADDGSGAIKLSCSHHHETSEQTWHVIILQHVHIVNKQGFQLLELVEGMMGTCLQSVTEFSLPDHLGEGGSVEAVIARLQRQKTQQIQKMKLRALSLSSRHCPNAVLLQKSKTFTADFISLTDFDAEDWSWFTQLLHQKKMRDGALSIEHMACDSKDIVKAKLEDLKKVWEAIDDCLSICYPGQEDFYRTCGEDGVHVGDFCPFRDEPDADMTECGWRRLQEIWREGQDSCA